MSILDLFRTTERGIPDINDLPSSTTMARPYYLYSLALQVILLLAFLLYFILSIYRVVKKIKNQKFQEIPEEHRRQEEEPQKTEVQQENQHQVQKPDELEQHANLIYRFDQDEEEGEEKKSQENKQNDKAEDEKNSSGSLKRDKEEKNDKQETNSVESHYNDYHDENEDKFIALDQKLLFVQPFLIGFIISNNCFAADFITIIAIILMIVSYFLFNLKGFWGHIRITPLLFIVFGLFGFLSFFIQDHDVST